VLSPVGFGAEKVLASRCFAHAPTTRAPVACLSEVPPLCHRALSADSGHDVDFLITHLELGREVGVVDRLVEGARQNPFELHLRK
jgi:hypothetical protein